jgi:hypothetical protein
MAWCPMASEYEPVDTVLDVDGDVVMIGVWRDKVIITIPDPDANSVHLDAAARDQFARAYIAASQRAEAHVPQ